MQQNPESFEELPYVRDTIKKLREIGIPVGIISNAFPSARKILEKNGLKQEFDEEHVILSYEYNSIKPERVIYQGAIDQAGVEPYEILFIDDRKSFVEGAAKHGMKAVIINDTEGDDGNGSGKSKFETKESLKGHLLTVVWFWNRWLKGNRNQLARLITGFLCYLRALRFTMSLLLRQEM
jgi:FMN phosphatase YigB (HAD superfamily)